LEQFVAGDGRRHLPLGALCPLDGSHARSRRNESKARQAQYELEDFMKTVKLEVKTGFLNLKTAWTTIQSQKENVVIAEENYRAAMAQFRNGIIDNTKLLNAHVQLLRARTMYVQAVHGYHTAKAQLNAVVGTDFFPLY
jgi:outer membrane protein TolC